MMRMTYKPRTHHRDAYGYGDTVAMMVRVNGRDLLDRATAALAPVNPHDEARNAYRQPPRRKFTDAEVAAIAHAARLAEKVAA